MERSFFLFFLLFFLTFRQDLVARNETSRTVKIGSNNFDRSERANLNGVRVKRSVWRKSDMENYAAAKARSKSCPPARETIVFHHLLFRHATVRPREIPV